MRRIFRMIGLLMALAVFPQVTVAEDIDIYTSNAGSVNNPNILIVLDNSSNWSAANQNWPTDTTPPVDCGNDCNKQGYYELRAMRELILGLVDNYGDASGNVPINVGLMMFNNSNASRDGGYVRSAVMPMTPTNRAALVAKLDEIILNFNTETASSSVQYGAALFDAFKYFGGFTNPANAATDTAPSTNPSYSGIPVFGVRFWGSNDADGTKPDVVAYDGSNYVPVTSELCGKNYIIFIGNGFPAKDDSASSNMGEVLRKLTNPASPASSVTEFNLVTYSAGATCSNVTTGAGNACQTSSSCTTALNAYTSDATVAYACNKSDCSGSQKRVQACNSIATSTAPSSNAVGRYGDEYTDFLRRTDVSGSIAGQQYVTTYAIDVFKDQRSADQSAMMTNMAKYGGGKYYAASDLSSLKKAFDSVLSEIQSVNSVFASSSLPVSVNTQGTYLNQVFMGMFRPDGGRKPRWAGNLKQYQLAFFHGDLHLADKTGTLEAVSATTGFVTPCAASFWTTDTANYWQFNSEHAEGLCNAATKYSDAPDGPVVEKGGAAQRLRGVTVSGGVPQTSTNYSTRSLLTCDGSSATSCSALTTFNTTNTGLSSDMVDWIRGKDLDDENATTATGYTPLLAEMRPSVHGGVVHSQPAVVDYGGTTGVVVFYGADDGVLHAVNGKQTDSDGNELWGFIAPESRSKFSRLRLNSPLIHFPNFDESATVPTPQAKDYFFDGSVSVHQKSGAVWIYPTMRRGGRSIYAFDVSDPANPTLKWRKGCFTNLTTDSSNCSSGWGEIGQTWSKPQVGYLRGYVNGSNQLKPVLVFGGGYDTCEDVDSQTRCTTTPRKGANVWFVDADTGALIRTYSTHYSVPGDVALLKEATTGVITHVYAADTGGYVYRINVGTSNADASVLTSWSSTASTSDITLASLSETGVARKFLFGPDVVKFATYNTVIIGSGDREHPLADAYACEDFAHHGGVQNQAYMIKDRPNAYPASVIRPTDLTDVTSNLDAQLGEIGASGWRFDLGQCEQTVNKALTVAGVAYFGTNAPKVSGSDVCGSNLGDARGYAVNFLTGAVIGEGLGRSVLYTGGGLPPSPVAGIVQVGNQKVPFIIGGGRPDQSTASPLEGAKVEINPQSNRFRVYWYQMHD